MDKQEMFAYTLAVIILVMVFVILIFQTSEARAQCLLTPSESHGNPGTELKTLQ